MMVVATAAAAAIYLYSTKNAVYTHTPDNSILLLAFINFIISHAEKKQK